MGTLSIADGDAPPKLHIGSPGPQNLHRTLLLATGGFHLDRLPRPVTSAYLLSDPTHTPLKLTHTGEALDVQLPANAPDAIASVLVLETAK